MNKTIVQLIFFISILVFGFSGCATQTIEIHPPKNTSPSSKKIALFLDGTANDRDTRTNVAKLYEIVANQERDNLYLYYAEGVGTYGRFLGAMTGWGIDKDVKDAYLFLTEHYSDDSDLYFFGFSRGAYTARILAGMLHTVGIYDLSLFNKEDKQAIIYELYHTAYKGKQREKEQIQKDTIKIIKKWRDKRYIEKYVSQMSSIKNCKKNKSNVIIKVMGLWDTVEALGVVPSIEALQTKLADKKDPLLMTIPNDRYYDSICNIDKVFHALALDDNRQNVFTPIIMTYEDINKNCKDRNISKDVEEVWFSGAHADVGGGYEENTSLSGVSLNWMINSIRKSDKEDSIIPLSAKVYQNVHGKIHDAESDIKIAYNRIIRAEILKKYREKTVYERNIQDTSSKGIIKVHESVFKRLKENTVNGYNSEWYKGEEFKDCFKIDNNEKVTVLYPEDVKTDHQCLKVIKKIK